MSEWKTHNKSQYGESWDFDKNKVIEGIYKNHRSNVGKNHQEVYEVEVKGETFSVWGSKILNDAMADVNLGDYVMITLKGVNNNPKYANPLKLFEVKSREMDDEDKTDLVKETKEEDLPF